MNDIILMVLQATIAAFVLLVTRYFVPYIRERYLEKLDESTKRMIKEAVTAFEQSIKGSGMGPIKKEEVLNFSTEWLAKRGINISQEEINVMIEAAVWALNNGSDEE